MPSGTTPSLANQGNAGISVENTTKYLEELFRRRSLELDIYTEGWDSQAVNCYNAAQGAPDRRYRCDELRHAPPGYITSPYGYRRRFRRMHKGVDLKLNIGDTVRAAFDGKVRIVRNQGARKAKAMACMWSYATPTSSKLCMATSRNGSWNPTSM